MHEIILIEDDIGLNRLIRKNLEKNNIFCDFAYNGNDALNLIQKNNYQLALIDYRLPDYNGLELSKKILQISDKIGFIIITGYGDQNIAVEFMKQGALDYISKDFNLDNILPGAIIKALETIKLKNELVAAQKKLIESEMLYRTLVKQIPDIIIIHNNGKIMFINDSISNYFELKPYELLNKNFFNYLDTEVKEKVINNLQNIKSGSESELFEIYMFTKNDEKKYFNIQNEEITYKKKKSVLTVLTDITKIKNAEEKTFTAVINAQENEKASFAENLHDDLGPILSSIKIYSNLLISKNKSKKELKEYQSKLSNLVDMAISNTRAIANNLMPNILNDYGLILALESFIDTLNKSKTIDIKLDVALNNKKIEKTFEIIFYRVITELINNTLKHAKATNITIEIKVNNNILSIFYADNGRGIDLSKIDKRKTNMGLTNISNRLKSINADFSIINDPGFNMLIKKNLRENT